MDGWLEWDGRREDEFEAVLGFLLVCRLVKNSERTAFILGSGVESCPHHLLSEQIFMRGEPKQLSPWCGGGKLECLCLMSCVML